MLRKILMALFCVLTMGAYSQELKFAHFNSQEFMQNLPEVKEAMTKMDDYSKKYEAELQKMQDEFSKRYSDFIAQADTLPDAIKTRRTQELSEMQQKIENFRMTAMQDVQQKQQELITPIQEKVLKAVKAVADEQGFIYVFDTSVLLHVSEKSTDLTPLLKKKLNVQ